MTYIVSLRICRVCWLGIICRRIRWLRIRRIRWFGVRRIGRRRVDRGRLLRIRLAVDSNDSDENDANEDLFERIKKTELIKTSTLDEDTDTLPSC